MAKCLVERAVRICVIRIGVIGNVGRGCYLRGGSEHFVLFWKGYQEMERPTARRHGSI
jgi:hypothetical protein